MSGTHVILNVNVLDLGISAVAWELSGLPKTAVADGDYFAEIGRIAERGTLDALFLADNPALRDDPRVRPPRALEPTTILATVAAATTHLGLIGTLSTTFNDPVELADRLLTLDHLSAGRAAWNAVTTYNPAAGGNFGLDAVPDRAARYHRAHEFVDVVTALWRAAVDGGTVDHAGTHFQVAGRLPLGASPQGHPLVVQAGGSPQGRALAGRTADAVFSAELSRAAGVEHYEQVKEVAVAHGRDRRSVAILPGLITIIGSTHAEAVARYTRARELQAPGHEIARLGAVLARDLRAFDLDAPFPAELLAEPADPDAFTASLGFRESVVRAVGERLAASAGRYTLREAVLEFGDGGHRRIIGSPEEVADTIEDWFRAGAADGFNLMPDAFPGGLEIFVDEVVPILRRRGLFRHEYAETTLRERFAAASRERADH